MEVLREDGMEERCGIIPSRSPEGVMKRLEIITVFLWLEMLKKLVQNTSQIEYSTLLMLCIIDLNE